MKALPRLRKFFRFALRFMGSLEVEGVQHVPDHGPYVIVLNHMSIVDVATVLLAIPDAKMPHIRFFAGEKWQNHPIFGPMLSSGGAIYINRGQVDRKPLQQAVNALKSGEIFGLAPEGTRSKVGHMNRARDGAAYLASRAGVPLLPIGLTNTDTLFYNLKRGRRTKIRARIGPMFQLPDLGHRARGDELTAYSYLIMSHITLLLPERYHGFYAGTPILTALEEGEDPWPHCLAAAAAESTPG